MLPEDKNTELIVCIRASGPCGILYANTLGLTCVLSQIDEIITVE